MTEKLADGILAGLKPFQRATVEHAFEQLFAKESTKRFLVADEVGLGKTMVARGVIAKTIDRLRSDGIDRIDVIYVCSNQVIARQNISKLNVIGAEHDAVMDRVTMLPAHLKDLAVHRVNLIPLTPQTSLDLRSSTGAARERAMIWHLLDQFCDELRMDLAGPRRVLQGGCRNLDSFDWQIRWMENADHLNEDLGRRFIDALQADKREEGDRSLLVRFEKLAVEYKRKRKPELWREANEVVGGMRSRLARSCIDALEADLIILDEFQRFRNLLDPENPQSELATMLFGQETARVLMLSATPYKMLTQAVDREEDHHQDFLATLGFLFDGDQKRVERCKKALRDLRTGLKAASTREGQAQAKKGKRALERELRTVMSRTERLVPGADRNAMVKHVDAELELNERDVRTYADLDRLARELAHPDITEYWKSSPYPLNFMDGYVFVREYESKAPVDAAARPRVGGLAFDDIRSFSEVDFDNPKMRALARDTLDAGLWKLLWLPPSLPYYRPGKPFSEVDPANATKRLVFSAWTVVPKAISCLLSYEAERRLVNADGPVDRENTPEARAKISGSLRLERDSETHMAARMTTFAVLYPSTALAELVDPLRIAQEHGRDWSIEQVLDHAKEVLAPHVLELTADHSTDGAEDVAWYAIAQALLDDRGGESGAIDWLDRWETKQAISTRGNVAGGLWALHVDHARKLLRDPSQLGRVPENLVETLALLAVGSPATCAVRSMRRVAPEAGDVALRDAGLAVSDGLRGTYNLPEVKPLISATHVTAHFWQDALHYGANGNLQAVLDEYAHVLREWAPIEKGADDDVVVQRICEQMTEAIGLQAPSYEVREIDPDGVALEKPISMRNRFALRFGDGRSAEDEKQVTRAGAVRTAFNSPFWPFVLSTTSVGQEGLDFHLYSHAIVHWNLPSNPVDFEQREGRVHRYKCHAIRKNVAVAHGEKAMADGAVEPWRTLFECAAQDGDKTGLIPFWIYDEGPTRILRSIPTLPWSRDVQRHARLERMLGNYRLTFGQPRQDELLAALDAAAVDEREVERLMVDLRPK